MNRILWLSLRFLLLYAVLQSAFSFTPLGTLSGRLVGNAAAGVLTIASGENFQVAVKDRLILLQLQREVQPNVKPTAKLAVNWYTRTVPLYLAFLFAATWRFTRRLAIIAAAGLVAVLILDGVIAAAHAWNSLGNYLPRTLAGHLLGPFGEWSLGGFSVAPIFVAGIALFLTLNEGESEGAAAAPGRNAPCPCGSGLKYKRCCGAPAPAAE